MPSRLSHIVVKYQNINFTEKAATRVGITLLARHMCATKSRCVLTMLASYEENVTGKYSYLSSPNE
jgi:chemotaxis receptor (MCP) glutamine deamidase CheD